MVFGGVASVYFLAYFHRVSTSVVAPDLIAEFQSNATALGLMSSMYFYAYALGQPLVGYLVDRLGPRRVIGFWTLLAALGCVLFGIAPSIAWAAIGRGLIGFGVGGVYVPAVKAFAQWFRPDKFTTMTGLLIAPSYIKFFGGTGNSLQWGIQYFQIFSISFLFMILLYVIGNCYRGMGNTKTPMMIMLQANIMNIVLDPMLIFGWAGLPAMGVRGAAIASLISHIYALGIYLYLIFLKGTHMDIKGPWRLSQRIVGKSLYPCHGLSQDHGIRIRDIGRYLSLHHQYGIVPAGLME